MDRLRRGLAPLVALVIVGALSLGLASVHAAQDATPRAGGASDDPTLGDVVTYIGSNGQELGTVTIDEIADPFEEYDPSFPPDRGSRFVLVTLTIENTGSRPLPVQSFDFILQDVEGFTYTPSQVYREGELGTTPATPTADEDAPPATLENQDLEPGDSVTGVLGYEVLVGVAPARVFFTPDSGRLILLADLRG